ncbi:CHY zinc finger protein [Lysinibacillus sp. NPDC056185]|uniref:CHY zinc finger protein n=1 Tax=Lysinibacillus sp. NPDC056185 TaxID=3345739 RepID=UPI0039F0EFFB
MKILGNVIDDQGRCKHYFNKVDTISIKFKCCGEYYPCYKCHEENSNHKIQPWKKEDFDEKAIFCGVCKSELTIREYMDSTNCKHCNTLFNPNCSKHFHIYFETDNNNPTCTF